MEISNDIKAKFFAMYLYQEVWCNDIFYVPMRLNTEKIKMQDCDQDYLLLRDISQLENTEIEAICKGIGLYHAEVVERDAECILVVDDSYSVGFYLDGTIVMYKGHGLHRKPYWNDIDRLYSSLICYGVVKPFTYLQDNHPITLSVDELISIGWVKIKGA